MPTSLPLVPSRKVMYRVAFWAMFGWMVFVCLVCMVYGGVAPSRWHRCEAGLIYIYIYWEARMYAVGCHLGRV